MKAKTKSQIATEYRISYTTFIKWLKETPGIDLKPNQRLLSPKQIKIFYEYYGNPETE